MSSPISSTKNSRIHVLPEALANQIAAGEVVERPASVVKELVENSIDAGATRIQIDIEAGGKNLIKVTDNGLGMSREDAELAFARHATSKIAHPEDLEVIHTLGFRGEALPSIASVAKVRLSTASDENQGGALVNVEGGTMAAVKDIACPRGTTLEVAHLFYNTPARKKFLKGDSTEFSHISQVVTQQALANPQIQFNLKHNGREIITTLPTDQLLYRIAELFGSDLAKELVTVNRESGSYKLQGYISSPIYTRSNRSAQFCFINQRFIRDKVILHATQQGYSHLLPRGRHPVIFLNLSMDPKLLDVNVHPSKAEVRFAFQQEVHQLVSEEVRNSLSRNEKASLLSSQEEPEYRVSESEASYASPKGQQVHAFLPPSRNDANAYSAHRHQQTLSNAMETLYKPHGEASRSIANADQKAMYYDQKPVPVSSLIFSEFEPLGQLDNSFIVLQGKKGMVIIDQHVAHERILYEQFRDAAKNKKVEVQQLLFPIAVEFSPGESELLGLHLEKLAAWGLELEAFGKNEFLLRSVPAILKNNDHEHILRDIVELLPRQGESQVLQEKYEDILIMMSCRNAIKVNHPMGPDQIAKLISDLERTELPFTCPHGRPIALFYDIEDLLRKFLRK
ncbi:MAG: DNA mismatch repair endonuclease MutL [Nitrospinae bacterium]|nr:DNA mismatch repair endonuclease MutL [Nitrospinota bacterium]MDA1108638.1 DNA mismatch repair endonuclease MutL [Nitrospinota bacterium]